MTILEIPFKTTNPEIPFRTTNLEVPLRLTDRLDPLFMLRLFRSTIGSGKLLREVVFLDTP